MSGGVFVGICVVWLGFDLLFVLLSVRRGYRREATSLAHPQRPGSSSAGVKPPPVLRRKPLFEWSAEDAIRRHEAAFHGWHRISTPPLIGTDAAIVAELLEQTPARPGSEA